MLHSAREMEGYAVGKPDQEQRLLPVLISRAQVGKSPDSTRSPCRPITPTRISGLLAGIGRETEIEPDLAEWGYGDNEGKLSSDIRQTRSDSNDFRGGSAVLLSGQAMHRRHRDRRGVDDRTIRQHRPRAQRATDGSELRPRTLN